MRLLPTICSSLHVKLFGMGSSLYSRGPMFPGSYVPRSGNIGLFFNKRVPCSPFFLKRVLCSPVAIHTGEHRTLFLRNGSYVPRCCLFSFFCLKDDVWTMD